MQIILGAQGRAFLFLFSVIAKREKETKRENLPHPTTTTTTYS